jgi:hypothetical protein
MKITIPAPKPRAKWLNDILLSKKAARHADSRALSRNDLKTALKRELDSNSNK